MCCFSRPVIFVAGTNIFARSLAGGRQVLVYSMTLRAIEELAMILPIPVKPNSGEDAVKFVSLEEYPGFFTDMEKAFAPPVMRGAARSFSRSVRAPLAVVEIGSFEASFVPTVSDFGRLDERFRLPAGTWDKLPQYRNYGFTVFKLKPGAKVVHPMAFEFPRADPSRLFFPTVHVHDGKVHPNAIFDHALYCQKMDSDEFAITEWIESRGLSDAYLRLEKTAGIVVSQAHCYKLAIRGMHKNTDTCLS